MKRWPWITLALAIILPFSPLGREIYHSAFLSGKSISRDLGQFLLYCIAGIMVVAIFVEWLIRWWLVKRRRT